MARTLKELMDHDVDNVFFNVDDFAEWHVVDGKKVLAIVDSSELLARKAGMEEGISNATVLIKLKRKDFGYDKLPGDSLEYDGKMCVVDQWSEDSGDLIVLMHQVVSAGRGAFDL